MIFQSGEKCKDFSKWSCCNGRPAQVENTKIFKAVKNTKIFQSGEKYKISQNDLVVMGNLPRTESDEKYKDFSKR